MKKINNYGDIDRKIFHKLIKMTDAELYFYNLNSSILLMNSYFKSIYKIYRK
jgi:hypothetical protein